MSYIVRVKASRPGVDAHTSTCITEHEPDPTSIGRYAQRLGLLVDVECEAANTLAGNGLAEIAAWLDRLYDKDPEPMVSRDRTSILIDEMTRGMRNQERRVSQLADTVAKLAQLVERSVTQQQRAIPLMPADDEPVSAEVDWSRYRRDDSEGDIVHAERRFAPRGRPTEYGAGSIREALDENRTAGVNRVVPGNMALRGAPATSEIMVADVDSEGNRIITNGALPKVGDTLKPIIGE